MGDSLRIGFIGYSLTIDPAWRISLNDLPVFSAECVLRDSIPEDFLEVQKMLIGHKITSLQCSRTNDFKILFDSGLLLESFNTTFVTRKSMMCSASLLADTECLYVTFFSDGCIIERGAGDHLVT